MHHTTAKSAPTGRWLLPDGMRALPLVGFSLLLSAAIVMDSHLVLGDISSASAADTYVTPLGLPDLTAFLVLSLALALASALFCRMTQASHPKATERMSRLPKSPAAMVALFAVIILVCWSPYVVSHVPGGIDTDTYHSILQALHVEAANDHQPIFYMLLFRFVFHFALRPLGLRASLIICTELQVAALSIAYAWFCSRLALRGFPRWVVMLAVAFYALFPLVPMYAVSLWKDSLFAGALLLMSTVVGGYVMDGPDMIDARRIIPYVAFGALASLLRGNGVYIFIATSLAITGWMAWKRSRRAIAFGASSLLVGALIVILLGPVSSMLGLTTDRATESSAIPIQQVAAVIARGGSIDDDDLDTIDKTLDVTTVAEVYDPLLVDTIKWDAGFDTAYFESHTKDYLGIWQRAVLANPSMTLEAALLETAGYWSPTRSSSAGYAQLDASYQYDGDTYETKDLFQRLTGFPLAETLRPHVYLAAGFFFWILLFAMALSLSRRRGRLALPLLPGFLLWGTLMVAAPIAFNLRYVFSLVLLLPVVILVIVLPTRSQENGDVAAQADAH